MASDAPSRDPRTHLPAAIEAATADDLDTALTGILVAGTAALGPTTAVIFLADPDRAGLQLAASVGLDEEAAATLAAAAQQETNPFATVAASRSASYDISSSDADGASIGAYVPLMVGSGGVETVLGTLGLSWPSPHATTAEERSVIEALASLAAIATDRARHVSSAAERSEWFERMAHTDPLTGIANERTVARVLELELARAGRQGGEVSLALFDIDDFRSANAGDGHQVGDDILRRVAAVLAESVRLVDTVGRIGGDEFVLVAPGAAGAVVAKRVQDGIAALPAVAGRAVSVSAGVARFPADAGDAESLIAAATDALTRAKDAGSGSVAGAGPKA
ncbi:MAG TPA: sensor domain-containing diguanylate cyclase [Candidatus Limnocylindrales bacterium]|nr:sensor domain-containing diguanylate cyclase [Candidatus Limnocylindrales bacterium]